MTTTGTTRSPAGTAELYWEARGSGGPVLLIPGTPGDGGQFDDVAKALARHHLVITYDRRGTSRSPRPDGWTSTSVAEQATDAAHVLQRVGVGPAVVFGTSNGAAVALELALRHPRCLAGVMLHEMPLVSVLADPAPVVDGVSGLIGAAMAAGGPVAGLDAFVRFAHGDAIVDGWDPELRARMLANADVALSIELPAFQGYRPDEDALGACAVPAAVLVGRDEPLPFFAEAARWLAQRLGTVVTTAPGAHGPQFSHPDQLAQMIRRFGDDLTPG
jgi:pimeloyl-ACP methyl ester carboxylesterase